MTPMPPAWAMAMARRASVTVSIADDSTGTCKAMDLVTREETSTSFGSTLEAAGLISTSSKVSATAPSGNCLLSAWGCPSGIGQPLRKAGGSTRESRANRPPPVGGLQYHLIVKLQRR